MKSSSVKMFDLYQVEESALYSCELFDVFFHDREEIKEFLLKIQTVFNDFKNKKIPIYLNFDRFNKCVLPSTKKKYLVFPIKINKYLSFKTEEQLNHFVDEIISVHDNFMNEEAKARGL